MNDQRTIIVVTGRPATGKSALVALLCDQHGWPAISKDAIKEALFDSLGTGDRAWSRRLSDASYELMFRLAPAVMAHSRTLVLEGNFRAPAHASRIEPLASALGAELLVVTAHARADVIEQRLRARADSDERHPGHLDRDLIGEVGRPLAGETSIAWSAHVRQLELDTTELDDALLASHAAKVAAFAGCR